MFRILPRIFFAVFFVGLLNTLSANEELDALLGGLVYDPTKTYAAKSGVMISLSDGEIYTSKIVVPAAADGSNGPNGANADTYWGDPATTTNQFVADNPNILNELATDIDTTELSEQVGALIIPTTSNSANEELDALLGGLVYDPTKTYAAKSAVMISVSDGEIYTSKIEVPAAADGSNGPNGANAATYWGDSSMTTNQFFADNPTFLNDLPTDIDTTELSKQVGALTNPTTSNFVVTVSSVTGGFIPSGGGTYGEGSTATITAIPIHEGYIFSGWSGDASGNSNPLSIFVDSDKTITSNFIEDNRDDDGDGLTNFVEIGTYGTNKLKIDSDADGLSDSLEVEIGSNPNYSDLSLINYAQSLVTTNPSSYELVSKAEHEQAIESAKNEDSNASPYTPDWFFIPERGWMWTDKKVFPWFYDADSSNWLYFKSGEEKPTFYHDGKKQWIVIE